MDEEADLALLDQHLLKTNQLGQRMTNILGQLDTRLSRLDKAIAPLGIQPLTRKDAEIEAILSYLSGGPLTAPTTTPAPSRSAPSSRQVSSASTSASTAKGYSLDPSAASTTQSSSSKPASATARNPALAHLTPIPSAASSRAASPADDTALLHRGPDIMSLGEYFGALDGVVEDLERMWKGLVEGRGGAREAGVADLSKLVETGFSGMVQLLLKLAKDGQGRIFDVDTLLNNGPPTPPNLFPPLNTLLPLTTKLTAYLFPPNPTPKTAGIIQPIFEDAVTKFAALRGDWICRSLSGLASRVEEADEGGIWENGGREKVGGLVTMWEAVLAAAEAETMLITTLFPNHPPPTLLAQTLSHPVTLAHKTLAPTLTTLKRSLSQHTFTALELYAALSRLQVQWDSTLSACLSRTNSPVSVDTKDLVSSLNQPVATLRSLSLRSFPETLADIRTARADGTPPTSAVSEVTYSTIGYLESLVQYESTVESLLAKSISERSWLMGMKEPPSSVRNAGEEGGIVKFFIADVLGTLLIHLQDKSKAMRRPIGQAFMLNNASHIRTTLIIQSNSDITGPGAESMLNKAVRDARGQYISEFTALTALLTAPPHSQHTAARFGVSVPTSERQTLKDASHAFFDKLQELEGLCAQFPLNRQDPEMRDSVAREVEGIVRGGYEGFAGRCQSKGAEKYLRGTADDVARRVQAIFR
ncbi:hypothetical protein IAT38_000329 [Cryptococcus sp. DSM 104549]